MAILFISHRIAGYPRMKSKIEAMISALEKVHADINTSFTNGVVDGLNRKLFPQS